ncbi:integrase core domain-containing protein [Desulfonatronovibrio hydrogenovorans]|uniref:integrase core domain-containing protein n=1 Tax=Desulfonatronovibrio hydrogenovorans TaxID=53245 RepID=UPI000A0592A9
MIQTKTGCYFALERLFHPQNGHCKGLQVANGVLTHHASRVLPEKPFKSLSDARTWVEGFVLWYNHDHRHSSLVYVTPNDRHTGRDKEILARRRFVYQRAKMKNPERWSGQIRKWSAPSEVTLNKKKNL